MYLIADDTSSQNIVVKFSENVSLSRSFNDKRVSRPIAETVPDHSKRRLCILQNGSDGLVPESDVPAFGVNWCVSKHSDPHKRSSVSSTALTVLAVLKVLPRCAAFSL